jgi:hypothetical protein
MKQFIPLLLAILACISACSSEQKRGDTRKPEEIITDTMTIYGTVVGIDNNTRMVTLRDKSGSYATFRVEREVKNLDRILKGDNAVAAYIESIGLRILEPQGTGGDEGMKGEVTVTVGLKEGKPYKVTARIIELMAAVDSINHRTRYVSIRGQKGSILSFKVGKSIKNFENVNRGDLVVIYYTEPIAILIEKTNQSK